MLYTTLDNIEKKASRLVYGTTGPTAGGDDEKAFENYDIAYDLGFRIFDTAYSYGKGEETLGRWLQKSGHRDDVIILDKGCNPRATYTTPDVFSAETIRTQMTESLERLQTDHVELYILHRDDPAVPVDEIVEVLNEMKAAGKVVRFGGSNWSMERTIEANVYAEKHGLAGFTVCSPNYTYARLLRDPWGGSVTITGKENQAFRDYLKENQMPIFNYSSLARGFLSGKYKSDNRIPVEQCIGEGTILEYYAPENVERLARAEKLAAELNATVPQIAIAWLMKQPLNLFPLVAPTGEAHIKEAADALKIELTDDQMSFLDADVNE